MNYRDGINFIKKHNAVGEDDKIGLQKTVVTTFWIVRTLNRAWDTGIQNRAVKNSALQCE